MLLLLGTNDAKESNWDEASFVSEYDALVAESTRELDLQKRRQLMTQAQQRLLDDYALLPLYDYVSVHLVSPAIQGWQSNPMDVHPLRYLQESEQ